MKNYTLETIVFICGAAVMILEILGARILAPFMGTSMFVWTSLIGVVLGSLSLGYWLGGKAADKKPDYRALSAIILFTAVFVGIAGILKSEVLFFLDKQISDIRLGAIVASLILLALPSCVLGMVSPYAVRLRMKDIQASGRTVGNLYAISTIGSILGTFLAGFFLIPFFGNTHIFFLLSLTLIFASLLAFVSKKRASVVLVFIVFLFTLNYFNSSERQPGLILDTDTQYNRVWILYGKEPASQEPIKKMRLGNEEHSAMFLNDEGLVSEYLGFFNLVSHFNPSFQKSLMIGGGAYSYPKEYLKKFPTAELDVVEIDPKLTELAREHFNLKENPRLTIYHEDGRVFLNRTKEKYDAVFIDAYRSFTVPYQLTTKEAIQKIYEALNDDGVVFANMISSIEGGMGKFLRSEYATYKTVFPQVYLFPVLDYKSSESFQNIVLLALKSVKKPFFESKDEESQGYLQHLWSGEVSADLPVLTDDYAPVDYYVLDML